MGRAVSSAILGTGVAEASAPPVEQLPRPRGPPGDCPACCVPPRRALINNNYQGHPTRRGAIYRMTMTYNRKVTRTEGFEVDLTQGLSLAQVCQRLDVSEQTLHR